MVVIAEYIWIGGNNYDLRSKSRTIVGIDIDNIQLTDFPIWNYDGSSTNQASGDDSEVLIVPVSIYDDPFRGENHKLVLCETMLPSMNPAKNNNRHCASIIFQSQLVNQEKPWFGIEQEYVLFENDGKTPLGWPVNGYPEPQGPYYCGVGASHMSGRTIADEHYKLCLDAGLTISGINAEVMKSQWEYQVGPCYGIEAGDQLWVSRYILVRICEKYNACVSFEPKPIEGDWNGSGCHINYSTQSMRDGINGSIEKALVGLRNTHDDAMLCYGLNNDKRMTGQHETSNASVFSYGVANRKCSIRIPRSTAANMCGYIEDRRPGSNIDPYLATSIITDVTLLREFDPPDFTLCSTTYYQSNA